MRADKLSFNAAKSEIKTCSSLGSDTLYLSGGRFEALKAIPPEIQDLPNLKHLHLGQTQIFDLAPISKIASLKSLFVHKTKVASLEPISELPSLEQLYLTDTEVFDLAPLEKHVNLRGLYVGSSSTNKSNQRLIDISPLEDLKNLEQLGLSNTKVADLSPLESLVQIVELFLANTPVTDLYPLSGMKKLERLGLTNTNVHDLSVVLKLKGLAESPRGAGLTFKGCLAAQQDDDIELISKISDASVRAQCLCVYLKQRSPNH